MQPGSSLLAWEARAGQQMWDACEQTPGVQAGISEAAGALTQLRRTSTSTAGGDSAAIRGTRRRLSTPREAVRPRCRDVWHVPLTSGQSPPEGFQFLGLSCNDSKGTGKRCTLAHIDSKKRRYACNEIKLPAKEFDTDRTARDEHARAARCATPQPEQ